MRAGEAEMAEFVLNLLFTVGFAGTFVCVVWVVGGGLAALWRWVDAAVERATERHRAATRDLWADLEAARQPRVVYLAAARARRRDRTRHG